MIAWTEASFARRSPSREGLGTLPGSHYNYSLMGMTTQT